MVSDPSFQSSPMANTGDGDCRRCLQHDLFLHHPHDGALQLTGTCRHLIGLKPHPWSQSYLWGEMFVKFSQQNIPTVLSAFLFSWTEMLRYLYPLDIVRMMFLSLNSLTTYLKSWRCWFRLDPVLNRQTRKHGINTKQRIWHSAFSLAAKIVCLYVSKSLLGSENYPAVENDRKMSG